MTSAMRALPVLKPLSWEDSIELVGAGAAFVDLRPIDDYLDVHVPGSLALLYEFGPGMATRARDCIPLDVGLILLDLGAGDLDHAAASLKGKGFTVHGRVEDAINQWSAHGNRLASTEVVDGDQAPQGLILDVADPGARPNPEAMRVPADGLWSRAAEIPQEERVVIATGYGVRAALAVGMLERAGAKEVLVWRTPGNTQSRR